MAIKRIEQTINNQLIIKMTYLSIYRDLNLRKPIYQQTSCYGHFGRDCFPWEQAKELDVD